VYDALKTLSGLSGIRKERQIGRRLENWFKERGFDYSRFISKKTAISRRADYEFGPNKTFMPEHIKLGSSGDPRYCLRIHMNWKERESRWTIGWVGRHLPNDFS
jgi:hypothetical protein